MNLAWLKLAWKHREAVGLALIAFIALWMAHSYGNRREAKGVAQEKALFDQFKDTQYKLAVDQLAADRKALLAYQKQVKDADDENTRNAQTLANLRRQPVARLRCTAAAGSPSADTVPADTAGTSGQPARDGKLPPGSDEGFDPSPAVMRLADRADDVVEACRTALAKWPK